MASNPHVPLNIESEEFKLLECFCVIIYDKTSSLEYVNEARRELFCQKNKTMETIPPTQDAFLQHCRRASYQAGIWSTSDRAHQVKMDTFRGIQLLFYIGTPLCCHHVDLHSEEMLLAAKLVGMSRPSTDISHNFCSLYQSQCIILVVTTFHRSLKIIQDSIVKANLVNLFSYAKIM